MEDKYQVLESNIVILTYHFKFPSMIALKNAEQIFKEAQQVANYAVENKNKHNHLSTKEIKGLLVGKSAIANQILKKYSNKTIKIAKNVHLIIPNQSIKYDGNFIKIKCLELEIPWRSGRNIQKINQIEIHKDKIYINVTIKIPTVQRYDSVIGIDLNTTHHQAVLSNIETGKIYKLDKCSMNIRKQYQSKRRYCQTENDKKTLREMRNREKNRTRDILHKLTNKIIKIAEENKSNIAIEDLTNIRENTRKRSNKTTRRATNSWAFSRFRFILDYKCKLRGITLHIVDPAYTSQMCSKCIHIGSRNKKEFKCNYCGHHDHADVNAGFCIARRAITSL